LVVAVVPEGQVLQHSYKVLLVVQEEDQDILDLEVQEHQVKVIMGVQASQRPFMVAVVVAVPVAQVKMLPVIMVVMVVQVQLQQLVVLPPLMLVVAAAAVIILQFRVEQEALAVAELVELTQPEVMELLTQEEEVEAPEVAQPHKQEALEVQVL
jgi:hypothetical protein